MKANACACVCSRRRSPSELKGNVRTKEIHIALLEGALKARPAPMPDTYKGKPKLWRKVIRSELATAEEELRELLKEIERRSAAGR